MQIDSQATTEITAEIDNAALAIKCDVCVPALEKLTKSFILSLAHTQTQKSQHHSVIYSVL